MNFWLRRWRGFKECWSSSSSLKFCRNGTCKIAWIVFSKRSGWGWVTAVGGGGEAKAFLGWVVLCLCCAVKLENGPLVPPLAVLVAWPCRGLEPRTSHAWPVISCNLPVPLRQMHSTTCLPAHHIAPLLNTLLKKRKRVPQTSTGIISGIHFAGPWLLRHYGRRISFFMCVLHRFLLIYFSFLVYDQTSKGDRGRDNLLLEFSV